MYTESLQSLSQGEVVQDVTYKITTVNKSLVRVEEIAISYPHSIVLNQTCDLERDYELRHLATNDDPDKKNDANLLRFILFAPMFKAEDLKNGEHLKLLGLNCKPIPSKNWKDLIKNENKRYHFFSSSEEFGLPDYVVDFKHFYSIETSDVYEQKQTQEISVMLDNLFREDFSMRFAHYLSRVGLPFA